MTRQEFLEHTYSEALLVKFRNDPTASPVRRFTWSPAGIVELFTSYDPTHNKRFSRWLIEVYLKDGFLADDLYKAKETLELFESHKKALEPHQRDIGAFRRLSDLWGVVKKFDIAEIDDQSPSGKEKKRIEKQLAYEQSLILRDEPDVTVAVPMTEYAAKWWGRGTRWCTAANRDNAFQKYHEDAPLIVIDLKENGKFQMHAHRGTMHFNDADDNGVSWEKVAQNWDRFKSAIMWALKWDDGAFYLIPESHLTYDHCLQAVTLQSNTLQDIPRRFRTFELCKIAVMQGGWVLKHVPKKLINSELCDIAISGSRPNIEFMPKKFLNLERCKKAVSFDGSFLFHVPVELRNYEICSIAVASYGSSLAVVPDFHRDAPLCYSAVQQDGLALKYVPDVLKGYDLCKMAVEQNKTAIKYVPEELRSKELYKIAGITNPRVIDGDFFARPNVKLIQIRRRPKPDFKWFEDADFIGNLKAAFKSDADVCLDYCRH